jgi:formylglycine-generating enzyme required for sulfatase activity
MQKTAATRNAETKTKVFISYSRKDMAFADRLEAALKARGFEVLIDREEIYAFEDWWKRIQSLIGQSDTIIFVLSPAAVASREALREVEYAASLNKRFAPIVCGRVEDSAVPEVLRRLNFIFFEDPSLFEASTDKLAEALQTDIVWVRRHTEFGEAARRWIEAGRASGLMLRSPVLEQAEAWMAFRPSGAPAPSGETQLFIAASRKAETAAKRRSRILNVTLYTMLLGIILGLLAWINQTFIAGEWRWYTSVRPFLAANVWPYALTPEAEAALTPGKSFRECAARSPGKDYCPDMIVLPAGSFWMGARPSENQPLEHPQHEVTIAKPFAVSKYELTFDEWDTCATYGDCANDISDGSYGRGQQPVINVTWNQAQTYIKWLSKITGNSYRLLSEAEYEYAARAGTQTTYPWGNDIQLDGKAMANCFRCGSKWDNKGTAPVGSFDANAFGLYDVVGNVAAWTQDCVHNNYNGAPSDGSAWLTGGNCDGRILRGSSWHATADELRPAFRDGSAVTQRSVDVGFRIAQTIVAP